MAVDHYPDNLAGYLVASANDTEFCLDDFLSCKALFFLEECPRYWEIFSFRSEHELIGEEVLKSESLSNAVHAVHCPDNSFQYLILCRRSGSKALLLGRSSRVVESFLRANAAAVGSGLVPVEIGVDKLVRKIMAGGGPYRLSHVYCKVYGFGGALKAASFWGEDLSAAVPVRRFADNFTFSGCGLRSLVETLEILHVGSNGHISFIAPNDEMSRAKRLQDVTEALAFVRSSGFLRVRHLPFIFS